MKYMGSKRVMLQNGLGQLIREKSENAQRVVDLFCGGSSVAWFIAEFTNKPALAVDLQTYAVALADSILCRSQRLHTGTLISNWINVVRERVTISEYWKESVKLDELYGKDIEIVVERARQLCRDISTVGPVWNAYGGHYFSPKQALTLDFMLQCLPEKMEERSVCLAATISVASKCAASPGHTAQPFSPTKTAGKFIIEAWKRDPLIDAQKVLDNICMRYAQCIGVSKVGDALDVATELTDRDLVILDPPYSGVQYSRFYHVLETIARGKTYSVSGIGRYPAIEDRPQSVFSNKGQSIKALEKLLSAISKTGAEAILTFPNGQCSNGLSGDIVKDIAGKYFRVQEKVVNGRFSTLGGNNLHRAARQSSSELILFLH